MHQQQVAPLKVIRLLRVLFKNTFKPIKHLNGHSFNAILNCGIMNFLFVHKIQVQSVQRYDTQFVIDIPGEIATVLKRIAQGFEIGFRKGVEVLFVCGDVGEPGFLKGEVKLLF